ncbi:MAG: extensin family protein [Kofleriaceae bacterium]
MSSRAAPLSLLLALVVAQPAAAAPSPRYAPAASDAAVAVPLDAYAVDATSREIPPSGRFACPEVDLVSYRGTSLKLHKSVRVHRAFVERLARFEVVVAEVARRIYGRAPIRLRHAGGYVCRRMKTYPTLLSEHALGNALDIAAFEFGSASRAERAAAPKGLRGSFKVVVDTHWTATRGTGAVHARFLRELADALIARPDIFRVMLGPSYPGHQDHLHFDASTFRMIEL